MSAETIFRRADIDPATLTRIPAWAIHSYMVDADGWLDEAERLLMFVGASPNEVSRFMYYIGEEHNRAVRGVGKGIVAYEIDEDRAEWLKNRVAR